jgi:hypothetical protein
VQYFSSNGGRVRASLTERVVVFPRAFLFCSRLYADSDDDGEATPKEPLTECCDPRCVPRDFGPGGASKTNPLTDWDDVPWPTDASTGLEGRAEPFGVKQWMDAFGLSRDGLGIQGDGWCQPECQSAACNLDDWDCCPSGQIADPASGHSGECCAPVRTDKVMFTLNAHGGKVMASEPQDRKIGLSKLAGGVLVHQQRYGAADWSNRFSKLYPSIIKGTHRPTLIEYTSEGGGWQSVYLYWAAKPAHTHAVSFCMRVAQVVGWHLATLS